MRATAVDLFAGAGGFTLGLQQAGIEVRLGIDIEKECQETYTQGTKVPMLVSDVQELSSDDVVQALDGAPLRILAGSPPCQPFSTYARGRPSRSKVHQRTLLRSFLRIALEAKPDIVLMENVPPLLKQHEFLSYARRLEEAGYAVHTEIVDLSRHGLPQTRTRLLSVASLKGILTLPLPSLNAPSTALSAIEGLPPLAAGERCPQDPLHRAAGLSPRNLKRMKHSLPGGTWRDWPRELVSPCHTKKAANGYSGVYGRINGDLPAPTITTRFHSYGSGRFGHPLQDRALSLREGAILQGFPARHAFSIPGSSAMQPIARLIGNALPPLAGQLMGEAALRASS